MLGSQARQEAIPGTVESSDIDYAILIQHHGDPREVAWARNIHGELGRRAAAHGFELCHRLNGVEVRLTPNQLFSQSSSAFGAGNLFTALPVGGDHGLFEEVLWLRDLFHRQDDGTPNAPYVSYGPRKAQFIEGLYARWLPKILEEVDRTIKRPKRESLSCVYPRHGEDGWKVAPQWITNAMQSLAVAESFSSLNSFDRIDEAFRRGILDRDTAKKAERALEFFMDQKARKKRGEPLTDATMADLHLLAISQLLEKISEARRKGA